MGIKAQKKLKSYGHVLYKIYTQDAHRLAVIGLLREADFRDLTIISAAGHGEGQLGSMESTIVLDVILPFDPETDRKMQKVVRRIRRKNGDKGQNLVIVLRIPCFAEYVWNRRVWAEMKGREQEHVQGALSFAAKAGGGGQ